MMLLQGGSCRRKGFLQDFLDFLIHFVGGPFAVTSLLRDGLAQKDIVAFVA